jgi:hypothetical protein
MTTTVAAVAAIAQRHHACRTGLAWLRAQPDLDTAAAACSPHHAYWLRVRVPDLPRAVARQAEQAAMRDPVYASLLRRDVADLPDDVAREAEQVARGGTGARP